MRVLMTSSVEPSLHSGVGSVEYNLIHGLRKLGVHVREYFPVGRFMALTDFVKGLSLRKHAKGCELIHSHTDISWATPGGLRTFHGVSALGERLYLQEKPHALMPGHKQKAYFVTHNTLEKICARNNKCVAVSNYVKEALVELYGADASNITTIYNGIDANTFSPNKKLRENFRERSGIADDAFLLTWVGHSEFNKGIHYLIQLMNKIAADKKNKKIKLAIRSPLDKRQLRQKGMSATALEQTICVPKQDSLAAFYNASDVHLLTSVYEPFCLTLLEAMACGKPVVASHSGGHVEVITRREGIITPLRNVAAIKNAVLQISASDSLRRKMGAAARKLILAGFTKEHMVRNTLAYYKKQIE